MHRIEKNILHHAKKQRAIRKLMKNQEPTTPLSKARRWYKSKGLVLEKERGCAFISLPNGVDIQITSGEINSKAQLYDKERGIDTTLMTYDYEGYPLLKFLPEDLDKVEYHVNELIEHIYCRGEKNNFKEDIENIETFFNYWRNHSLIKNQ